MFLYSISAVIKPQWACIWEYGFQGDKARLRTPIELTKREFESWVDKGCALRNDDPRSAFLGTCAPIESTRIDRNRVPLADPRFKLRPAVPEFDAPTEDELRLAARPQRPNRLLQEHGPDLPANAMLTGTLIRP